MASLFLFPFNTFSFLALSSHTKTNLLLLLLQSLSLSHTIIMKLAATLNSKFLSLSPKRLFRSKSKSSVTKSTPSSFNSVASSSSSDESYTNLKPNPSSTPISVLPWSGSDFHSELIQAFKLIDRDDDGVVSRRDLANLITKLSPEPPSHEEVSLMLREVDDGEDGCISLEDLANRVVVAGNSSSGDGSEEMREVFEFFDVDRDGRISAEELYRVFGVIGDERCTLDECRRMIATVDKNGDGFVCFDDFSCMMEIQPPSSSSSSCDE